MDRRPLADQLEHAASQLETARDAWRGNLVDLPALVRVQDEAITRLREAASLLGATDELERELSRLRHRWGSLKRWVKDEIVQWQAPTVRTEKHQVDMAVARLNGVLHHMQQIQGQTEPAPPVAAPSEQIE